MANDRLVRACLPVAYQDYGQGGSGLPVCLVTKRLASLYSHKQEGGIRFGKDQHKA